MLFLVHLDTLITKMNQIIALAETSITLNRNGYLKEGGSIDTNVYYIESGSIKIFVLDEGEEQIIRFGYKNNLVVSIDSFLTGNPSAFYIQAIKKTVVKVVTKKQMERFLQEDSNRSWWISILENLVLQQMEREIDILTSSPLERYRRVLERSPRLFQEIPHKHIANYLRMTPETLSRIKSVDFNQEK
jgi:CRP-like cAMP-binding protein